MKTIPLFLLGVLFTLSVGQTGDSARKRLLKVSGISKPTLPPILFNINKQAKILKEKEKVRPTKIHPKLLPNRLYLVFDEKQRKWVYSLTDFEGYLPSPFEAFRALTVLPGNYLGASGKNRYQLNLQGIWVRTFQKEQHYAWVYGTPPRLKTVTFKSVVRKK